MFTLSSRGLYGLTAVLELGVRSDTGPIQIKEIAAAHTIPQHYLEQILVALKKSGLVQSFRGNQGGYALNKRPDQIKVYDILACLEGELEVAPGVGGAERLDFFLDKVQSAIYKELDISLAELIQRYQKNQQAFIYSI
ncbi:RrF2 family transcriptional regulator [Spirochaeta dissipatitropha]